MTTAEIKEILNRSRLMCQAYAAAEAKTAAFRTALTDGKSIRYESDGSAHERDGNPVERALCKLADYSSDCAKLYNEWYPYRCKAMTLISLVTDDVQRNILIKRYINGLSWGAIARETGLHRRRLTRLHGYAIRHISKIT